jgi:hypothetical protein
MQLMERTTSFIEPLLEKVKEYGKTSLDLIRLKVLDKTAEILSIIASKLILFFVVFIFLITLNLAIGLWLGDLLGKVYYGFGILTLFYGVIAIVVYNMHSSIKSKINNKIISILIN